MTRLLLVAWAAITVVWIPAVAYVFIVGTQELAEEPTGGSLALAVPAGVLTAVVPPLALLLGGFLLSVLIRRLGRLNRIGPKRL